MRATRPAATAFAVVLAFAGVSCAVPHATAAGGDTTTTAPAPSFAVTPSTVARGGTVPTTSSTSRPSLPSPAVSASAPVAPTSTASPTSPVRGVRGGLGGSIDGMDHGQVVGGAALVVLAAGGCFLAVRRRTAGRRHR